ncbi:MAG: DUF368 domain-containing protein [SAR324 cluster bacterium]|nr:DUF368 domain-containing protein [SAR324 cluster bacterium]
MTSQPSNSTTSTSVSSIKTWKDVWMSGPGPETPGQTMLLMLKGICMGTADIIPGVSGGTIAFITGIYHQLLQAIDSINLEVLKKLLKFEIKESLALIHFRFLIPLFVGILGAVISTARLMHYLLQYHPIPTWSLFFGLISASIFIVGREISEWNAPNIINIFLGTLAAYLIVGMIPVQTPETWWFLFLSGMIAICAMILPGISGSFILLILGKYEFVTSAVKNPLIPENLTIMVIFAGGCVVGLLGFSRVLDYALKRYYTITMAVLTGFMIGAMRKVWPWKEVLETQIIRGKEYVIREENVLPALDSQLMLAIGIMLTGLVLVLALERWSRQKPAQS